MARRAGFKEGTGEGAGAEAGAGGDCFISIRCKGGLKATAIAADARIAVENDRSRIRPPRGADLPEVKA